MVATKQPDLPRPAYLRTAEVAARLNVSRSTVDDWMRHGCPVPGVGRVKLQFVRVGGQMMTRRRWVKDFIAACNPDHESPAPSASQGSERALRMQADAAVEELRRRGVRVRDVDGGG